MAALRVTMQPEALPVDFTPSRIAASHTRRFAVLGAGFAGVSVAWHLLQHTSSSRPICVDLFDEAGIGGGASGVSGGLLHPYTPRGKLLWKGSEGWAAALNLLSIAEAANTETPNPQPVAWHRGILRPALSEKHMSDAKKIRETGSINGGIRCLEGSAARVIVPGLVLPENGLALYMPEGLNIHPRRYLDALWFACEKFANDVGIGTRAVLLKEHVSSLEEISREGYEAVVVCAGSKAVVFPELAGKLPLAMCRGVVAHLELPTTFSEYNLEAPNLLSSTWMAVQGARQMVLGATKDWNCDPTCVSISREEEYAVQEVLLQRAGVFYPLIKHWRLSSLHAGVRAMPPRTPLGALPLAGCIDKIVQPLRSDTQWWLIGGLGSRGLIYHGWLGELVASAVVSGDKKLVLQELNQFVSRVT